MIGGGSTTKWPRHSRRKAKCSQRVYALAVEGWKLPDLYQQWRDGHWRTYTNSGGLGTARLIPTVEGWALPDLYQQWRDGHWRTYTNSGGLGTAGLIPTVEGWALQWTYTNSGGLGTPGLIPTVEGWALPDLYQQWRDGHCRTYTNSGGLGTAGLIPTTLQRMVISVCLRLSALLPAINNSWRQLTWPKRSVYLTSTMHIARKCPPFSSTTQWASTIIVYNNQIGNTGVCSDLLTLLHQ